MSLQFLHVMHIISYQKIHYCTDYCLMDFVQQQGERLIQSALEIGRSATCTIAAIEQSVWKLDYLAVYGTGTYGTT